MRRQSFSGRSWTTSVCVVLAAWLMGGVLAAAQAPQAAGTPPAPPRWPMEFMKDDARLIIYQPQLKDWIRFRDLTSDTAVSITPPGGKPVLGVVSWHAVTLVDTQARLVAINDIVVTDATFPSLDPAASTATSLTRTTASGSRTSR
jgi:hypothetical protein